MLIRVWRIHCYHIKEKNLGKLILYESINEHRNMEVFHSNFIQTNSFLRVKTTSYLNQYNCCLSCLKSKVFIHIKLQQTTYYLNSTLLFLSILTLTNLNTMFHNCFKNPAFNWVKNFPHCIYGSSIFLKFKTKLSRLNCIKFSTHLASLLICFWICV